MENEPPEHTRLRRLVAAAFARGHVERLRPRVAALAGALLDAVDPDGFDLVADYAEPLPVLGDRRAARRARRRTGRRCGDWSQAIVRMYEVDAAPERGGRGGRRGRDFAGLRARAGRPSARPTPRDDLVSDLVAAGPEPAHRGRAGRRRVLLLNAGHEASVNVLRQRRWSRCSRRGAAARAADLAATASRRCCASTRRCSCSSGPRRRRARWAAWSSRRARRSPRCSARPTATRPSSTRARRVRRRPRPEPAPRLRRRAALLPRRAAGPDGAASSRSRRCSTAFPGLALAGEPESRGTFVLRGFRRVPVGGAACMTRSR